MQPWGSVAPQLGLYLIEHGFEVEIVTMHPSLFTIASQFDSADALLAHLKSLQPDMKGEFDPFAMRYFIKFVEAGGQITPRIPDMDVIADEIAAGRPLITLLTHWFLFDSSLKPRFTGHFNVVSDIDQTHVSVNDPDWGEPFGGKHRHTKEHYRYAIFANAYQSIDGACLIKIHKK